MDYIDYKGKRGEGRDGSGSDEQASDEEEFDQAGEQSSSSDEEEGDEALGIVPESKPEELAKRLKTSAPKPWMSGQPALQALPQTRPLQVWPSSIYTRSSNSHPTV